jgi:curli biogenesis system outer membrane secretion channel CsgG
VSSQMPPRLSAAWCAAAALFASATLSGCLSTPMQVGDANAKTVATGSAAGAATNQANSALEKCDAPLGTISLVENQSAGWYTVLTSEYRLPPTASLLRLFVQQSNCFVVLERSGAGMQAMSRERALMGSGELRDGSQYGKGQMVASDYGLTPELVFSQNDTGGMAGSLGGLLGGRGGALLGVVGGSAKTREAAAMLTLVDQRSGVQIAASEGSAAKTDIGAFGALFGSSAGGRLGAYGNTPQGKVIAAAFMDAYNQMVVALRQYRAQSVAGQGLGGGGRLGVDGGAEPSAPAAPKRKR